MKHTPPTISRLLLTALILLGFAASSDAQQKKPNILIIWGDDIGYWNVSAYNQGMMGYKTPNIDRIAKEGGLFTDWYGQQSCTAGRGAFITGQVGFRTGLLKVGLPGAKEGLQARDVTLAQLLKAQGYATGQFGKNHLGDSMSTCPRRTVSTNFSDRSITSMPKTNRSIPTISKTLSCGSGSEPAASFTRGRTRTARRRSRAPAR